MDIQRFLKCKNGIESQVGIKNKIQGKGGKKKKRNVEKMQVNLKIVSMDTT